MHAGRNDIIQLYFSTNSNMMHWFGKGLVDLETVLYFYTS